MRMKGSIILKKKTGFDKREQTKRRVHRKKATNKEMRMHMRSLQASREGVQFVSFSDKKNSSKTKKEDRRYEKSKRKKRL